MKGSCGAERAVSVTAIVTPGSVPSSWRGLPEALRSYPAPSPPPHTFCYSPTPPPDPRDHGTRHPSPLSAFATPNSVLPPGLCPRCLSRRRRGASPGLWPPGRCPGQASLGPTPGCGGERGVWRRPWGPSVSGRRVAAALRTVGSEAGPALPPMGADTQRRSDAWDPLGRSQPRFRARADWAASRSARVRLGGGAVTGMTPVRNAHVRAALACPGRPAPRRFKGRAALRPRHPGDWRTGGDRAAARAPWQAQARGGGGQARAGGDGAGGAPGGPSGREEAVEEGSSGPELAFPGSERASEGTAKRFFSPSYKKASQCFSS